MIYTSYFAKVRSMGENAGSIVNIARKPMKGTIHADYLAPPHSLLVSWKYQWPQDDEHWKMYEKAYLAHLDSINIDGALQCRMEESWWDDKILCCFEKSDNKYCHRHILRKWLLKHGIESEELA